MNKMNKMKTSTSMVIAAGLGGLAALAVAVQVRAGGDKVAFPEGFEKGELYATVDRYDNKQYRELFATPAAVAAARKGEPIPSGTVLTLVHYKAVLDAQGKPVKGPNGGFVKGDLINYTVMEKRAGWGAEYPPDIRNGEWEYQAFNADKTVNEKANLTGCFQCHKPFEAQDYVMSLASLKGTKPGEVAAPKAGPGIVSIADFLFGPEKVTVAAGSAITWVNTDASPHQVTIKGKPQRTAVLLKGQSGSLSVAEAGTYEYTCGLHPAMKGVIEAK